MSPSSNTSLSKNDDSSCGQDDNGSSSNNKFDVTKPNILERFRLDNQIALVTGGGQGIGRAFCYALAQAGAAVAVVDIQQNLANKVANELQGLGYEAIPIVADVTQPEQVQRMIDETLSAFDNHNQKRRFTIGVNNAGIGDWMAAEDVTMENWNKIMNVNLKGVFLCAQAEAKVFLRQGYGKIINTASMSASIVNFPQKQVVYNTTKAAVKHMTKSLAVEFATKGIRVNCISPGYTRTALLVDLLQTPQGQEYGQQWKSMTPIQRFGEVTDYMGAIVYLASDASDFMTGHDMIIDGGYCAL